ncbi:hypothetical protein Q8F55_002255 [Vanrija albida]|uniref:Uncharacterized protein n=1 Tax=Vanrija albida TaxID=181172 RepID=A0ABR3Q9B0_9TREE
MGLLRKKVSKFSLKASKEDANRPPTPPPQLPPLPGHIVRQEQLQQQHQQQHQPVKDFAGPSQQQGRRRSRSLWSGSDDARLAAGSRLGRRGSLSATQEPAAQPWRSREAWLALHQSPVGEAAAVPKLAVPFGPGGDMPGWRSRGAPGGGFFGTAAELDSTIVRNADNSDGRRTPVPGTPSRRLRTSPSVPSLAATPSKLGRLEFAAPPVPSSPSPARSSPFTPRANRRRSRSVDSMAAFTSPAFEFSTPTEGGSANSSLLVTPPSAGPTPSLVHSAAERLSPPVQASPLIDDRAGSVLERVDSTSSDESEHLRPVPASPSRPSRAPARALPAVPVHAYSEDGHAQQYAVPRAFAPRSSLPTRGRSSSVTTSVPTVVPVPVVQQAVEAQVEGESETDAEAEADAHEVIDFSRPAPSVHTMRSRYSGPSSNGHGSMPGPASSHGHGYPSSSHGHSYGPASSHGHGSLPPSAMPANMVPPPQHAQMYTTAVPIEAGRPPTRTGSASSHRSFRTNAPSRSTSSAGHSDRDPHANAVPHTPQAIAHAVNVWRQKSKGKEGREEAEKAMNAAQSPSESRHTRRVPSFGSIRPRASRADRIEAAMRKQAPGGPDHWATNDSVELEPHVAADPFAHAGAWEAPNTYSVYGGINEFEPPAPIAAEPLFKPPTRLPQLGARPTTPQHGRPTTPQMMHHHPRSMTPQMHHRPTTPQMHHRPTTPQMPHHRPTTPQMYRPSALPYMPQPYAQPPQPQHQYQQHHQGHYIPAHKTQRMQQPVGQGGWI